MKSWDTDFAELGVTVRERRTVLPRIMYVAVDGTGHADGFIFYRRAGAVGGSRAQARLRGR